LGARIRKVTVLSAWTSGETIGVGGVWAQAEAVRMSRTARFMPDIIQRVPHGIEKSVIIKS
jgi:hypothetical protein